MPTAAKLIGAILFAALAWFVSEQVKLLLPSEGAGANLLSPLNALIGLAMGWRIAGARAGDGFVAAVGLGMTTIFATIFWALLVWSTVEMLERAVSGRYRGPIEAMEGLGDLMLAYSSMIVEPNVVGAALFGSILCAMITEYFSHRWS